MTTCGTNIRGNLIESALVCEDGNIQFMLLSRHGRHCTETGSTTDDDTVSGKINLVRKAGLYFEASLFVHV